MGDFQANFQRPTGQTIHTQEGNVAGPRAAALERQRQADQDQFEARKRSIQETHQRQAQGIGSKFSGASLAADVAFQQATVGLVTAAQFRELQAQKDNPISAEVETEEQKKAALARQEKMERKKRKRMKKEKKKMMATLSFAGDEEQQEDEVQISSGDGGVGTGDDARAATAVVSSSSMISKDPTIDTSFLPDRQRQQAEQAKREELVQQWKDQQASVKQDALEIVYSYWDGSGHRRTVTCRKGDTIGTFLELVRKDLVSEFRELGSVGADALLYVKEDLMLPSDLTFYDLITTKARGKSGPLFHFDVHDDVRVGVVDVRVEKDESHPGKVVQRHWYERNKHIFPASRWEIYDPTKEYGGYTIGGKIVTKKE